MSDRWHFYYGTYRYGQLVTRTYVAKVAMTKDNLILVPNSWPLLLRPPSAPPFLMTMAVRLPYYNIEDGGIASSISVVQLHTRYWRIDGVSEHRFETKGTRNGQILTSKHLHLCPSWCNGHRVRSRHNIRSTLQTFAKSSSYHCIVLTLSGDDRQKSPMMILRPSTRNERRPWRWIGSWCLCGFCEKWRVARSSCIVLNALPSM